MRFIIKNIIICLKEEINMRLFLMTTLLLAALATSSFGGIMTGKIGALNISSVSLPGNPTHVSLTETFSPRPSCATQSYMAINTDTPAGKSMLAALLSAQTMGNTITIWGTGYCTLRPDMEDAFQVGIGTSY